MSPHHPPIINGVPVPYGATVMELQRRLHPPGPAAWAALAALGDTPGEEALRLLCDQANAADWRYRRLAVETISRHALAPEAADVLAGALEDANTYVVITGCNAVAHQRVSQAHTRLVSLLSHPETPVREAAVSALAVLWEVQDFREVKRLHVSDASLEVRKAAGWTLMGNAGESTWRELYALWRASPMVRYRRWAIQMAHQFGGEEASELVKSFENDPDGHVRKAALSGRKD